MKITICGPVSLHLLCHLLEDDRDLPEGYRYPLAAYIAQTYHTQGHDISIVTTTLDVKKTTIWQGDRIKLYVIPSREHYLFCLDGYKKEIREMVRCIRLESPGIVHSQWQYEFARAGILSGFPCLVTVRDNPYAVFRLIRDAYRLYRLLYSHFVMPKIKYLSYTSPYMEKSIRLRYRIKARTFLVPNGIAQDIIVKSPRIQRSRNAITFTSIGAGTKIKNPAVAISAFAIAHKELPNSRLILIGPNLADNEEIVNLINNLQLQKAVHLTGALAHKNVIKELQENTDIYFHTSHEESFAMAVLEAMASGLPVIGGKNSGAIPWLLDYEKAGMLVDIRQPVDIARAMVYLANNSEAAQTLAKNALKRASECFSLESVASKYLAVYQEVIENEKRN
jgi:L-malate glycosyltransferase